MKKVEEDIREEQQEEKKNIPLRRTVSFQAPASDRDKNGKRTKLKEKWKRKIIPFMRSFLTIRGVPRAVGP